MGLEITQIIAIGLVVLLVIILGGVWLVVSQKNSKVDVVGLNEMMKANRLTDDDLAQGKKVKIDEALLRKAMKARLARAKQAQKKVDEVTEKLSKIGMGTEAEIRWFKSMRYCSAVFGIFPGALLAYLWSGVDTNMLLCGAGTGLMVGYMWPTRWLDKKAARRDDDLLYYLPLVIEQISIGVSSSLDIGPCLAHIVEMAESRDAHNPVTMLFVTAEKLMKSGLNLEDALVQVGDNSGVREIRNAMMFLSQCAKHGGEISKQLQEMANAVMSERQNYIDGKIKELPVKATGPLVMVFAGFFAMIFSGLFMKLTNAIGGV